ncbi:hypothetical protein [Thermoactinomyces sp. CICC 10522]|uniref:hypothetical protein n=1 Tax=Thermoactinomyces sp. CICC 10522 TaxID=2767427 RepID=UPI0018DD4554|nr:hypothetical protein [Thermoactinomyces sp. CICC 10522]MBH8605580.1 hypothetical protein [Thermoactinomyces sp. CICC 10522]
MLIFEHPFEDVKKGNFFCAVSTRQEDGYDIYFVPDGEIEMRYISTVPDWSEAKKHCKLYKKIHDSGVEEYQKEKAINEILKEIAETVHKEEEYRRIIYNDDLSDDVRGAKAEKYIQPQLEKKIGRIEEIKGSIDEKERKEYIQMIMEWFC